MNTTTAELNLNFSKFQLYMLHLKREFGRDEETTRALMTRAFVRRTPHGMIASLICGKPRQFLDTLRDR